MKKLVYILCILFNAGYAPVLPADYPEACWNRIISPNGKDFLKLNIDSNQVVFAGSWGDGLYRKDIAWKEITGSIAGKHINIVESGFKDSVYAGVWGGGIFVSPDKGDNWNLLTNFFNNNKLKCLSVYKNGFMIAGTYGYGIFKTYDAGKNWTPVNYNLCWRDINCLLALNDSVYFAGTNGGGLFRTTNAGSGWIKSGSGIPCLTITDIRKNQNNQIFVSTLNCGIYHSADFGKTWQKLGRSTLHPEQTNSMAITSVNNLFAATNNDGVIRYKPVLDTWEKTDDKRVNGGVNSIVSNSNSYLYCSMPGRGIHYSNDGNSWSDSVYSLNKRLSPFIALKDSVVISGNGSNEMFYSKDFGISWQKSAYNRKVNSLAADSSFRIFICRADGLDVSRYDFSLVDAITFFSGKNLSVVSVSSNGYIIAALNISSGSQQAALFLSKDGGGEWDSIAASDKSIKVAAFSPAGHIYLSSGTGMLRSTDLGESWHSILTNNYAVNDIRFHSKNHVYAATNKGLLISNDTGNNYRIYNFGRQKPAVQHVEVSAPGGIWVYLSDGQEILYSPDNGQNWLDWTFGYTRNIIEEMAISPHGYLYITSASIFRTVAPGYMKAPLLLANSDLPDKVNQNTVFRWNKSDPAELFNIQVSEDNFASILEDAVTAETFWQICFGLKNNTKYYLRVRGKVNCTYGPWSDVLAFNTAGKGPALISPADKSIGHGSSVTFVWEKLANPYRLQIAKDTAFTDVVADIRNISVESQPQDKLDIFTRYYWRVSAFRTGWSDIWSFTTKLAPPKLLEPLDSSQYLKQSAALKWEAAPGAQSYRLQVSDNYDFTNALADIPNILTTSLDIDISDGRPKYFWRVKAFNQFDESEWPKVFMFYTSSDSPILIYPEDNSAYVLADTTFRWDAPKNSVFYRLQVSSDSLFKESSIVYDSNFIKDKEIKLHVLDYGTQYYWRVRYYSLSKVNSDTLISAWSDVKTFSVGIRKVTLISPPDGAKDILLSSELAWEPVNCRHYYLQVSTREDFSSDVAERDMLKETEVMNNPLDYSTKYYWRVKAKAPGGEGPWSDIWSFTTKAINPVYDEINSRQEISAEIKYSSGKLIINAEKVNEGLSMEIFSLDGALLHKSEITDYYEYDITGFTAGSYLLRLSAGGRSWRGWFFRF